MQEQKKTEDEHDDEVEDEDVYKQIAGLNQEKRNKDDSPKLFHQDPNHVAESKEDD